MISLSCRKASFSKAKFRCLKLTIWLPLLSVAFSYVYSVYINGVLSRVSLLICTSIRLYKSHHYKNLHDFKVAKPFIASKLQLNAASACKAIKCGLCSYIQSIFLRYACGGIEYSQWWNNFFTQSTWVQIIRRCNMLHFHISLRKPSMSVMQLNLTYCIPPCILKAAVPAYTDGENAFADQKVAAQNKGFPLQQVIAY